MNVSGKWEDVYSVPHNVLFIQLRVDMEPFYIRLKAPKDCLPNVDQRALDFELELLRQSVMTRLQNGMQAIKRRFDLRDESERSA